MLLLDSGEEAAMAQRTPVLDPSTDDVIRAYERDGPLPISEEVYLRLALDDPDTPWELHDGLLVEKPGMSFQHGDSCFELAFAIRRQLDPTQYRVRSNHGRLHRARGTFFIPDVMVIPTAILGPDIHRPDVLERYDLPIPFVAKVWSPSTGRYDINTKLAEYRNRGDQEIWHLHPFERTVTAWRRRPDGDHDEIQFTGGQVRLHALPDVLIDLEALCVAAA
jgi:Uma2 family endonuclease